jgi:glycosyl transferase family 1
MSERLRALIVDANGWGGWKAVTSETIVRGVLGLTRAEQLPPFLRSFNLVKRTVRDRYSALSYAMDWRDALLAEPRIDATVCNLLNLVEYTRCRRALREYPLVIILHSATGDSMGMLRRTASWFQRRRGKLVVFVGNEYNLLEEKIAFIRDTGADYVASQLPIASARWLYSECTDAEVLAMPHALNPVLYQPRSIERDIDVGFVGADYPFYIGDRERARIVDYFRRHGVERGLRTDIRATNMPRERWAEFLSGCKGAIGAEAGTYYLDRSGTLIPEVEAYVRSRRDVTFDEVFDRFFQNRTIEMSGKAISSRHFEPIGTKTCQMLLEGCYNGILKPDEHYIAIRKDLSNVDDAIGRFCDPAYRTVITEQAYAFVMAAHTYAHRVAQLLDRIG